MVENVPGKENLSKSPYHNLGMDLLTFKTVSLFPCVDDDICFFSSFKDQILGCFLKTHCHCNSCDVFFTLFSNIKLCQLELDIFEDVIYTTLIKRLNRLLFNNVDKPFCSSSPHVPHISSPLPWFLSHLPLLSAQILSSPNADLYFL